MITKDTIIKFLNGSCSREELAAIEAALADNPDFLKDILTEEEWNNFSTDAVLPVERAEFLFSQIEKHTTKKSAPVFTFKRIAVAAAVVLIIGLGWSFLYNTGSTSNKSIADNHIAVKSITNTSEGIETVMLADSSLVKLHPGATISFPEFFEKEKRTVTLSGIALFIVKKDELRPFSVFSDSIVTTVLGTEFTINTKEDSNQLSVTLHKGKVSVQRFTGNFTGNISTYILQASDVFIYNKISKEAKISRLQDATDKPGNKKNIKPQASNPIIDGNYWYMFNNQSLPQVFDYLEQFYNVEIAYRKADLKGFTFIGKIDKTDTLESVLQSIALLNNLNVQWVGDKYVISRKK